MMVSDYIANFLANQGVTHIFGLTGAHILRLIDAFYRHPKLTFVPMLHEQGAGFAADAYARISGVLGVAVSTSGPGAANLVSPVCASYFDSIPVLYITGQVASGQMRKGPGLRQLGFQETDIVGIMNNITKYSACVSRPEDIDRHLQCAWQQATSGRPGAVHLDIPEDVQRMEAMYPVGVVAYLLERGHPSPDFSLLAESLAKASRPLILLGAGGRQAGKAQEMRRFVEQLGVPVLLTWGGIDLLPYTHPLNMGGFGICGPRAGNFALRSADFVLSIGARLDNQVAGRDPQLFAPNAWKFVVDIDQEEIEKRSWDGALCCDLSLFLAKADLPRKDCGNWIEQIRDWRERYPITAQFKEIDPYHFIQTLSGVVPEGAVILTDAGATLAWTMQAWRIKEGQRLISAWNHSPMGYALPGSVGAAIASRRKTICLTGDGSFQLNVQALATIARLGLPIKVFVLDNGGYGIIRQTQDTWLEGRHYASKDLGLPNPTEVARSYGIIGMTLSSAAALGQLSWIIRDERPMVIVVKIDPEAKIKPRLGKGADMTNLWPELSPEELEKELRCQKDIR